MRPSIFSVLLDIFCSSSPTSRAGEPATHHLLRMKSNSCQSARHPRTWDNRALCKLAMFPSSRFPRGCSTRSPCRAIHRQRKSNDLGPVPHQTARLVCFDQLLTMADVPSSVADQWLSSKYVFHLSVFCLIVSSTQGAVL